MSNSFGKMALKFLDISYLIPYFMKNLNRLIISPAFTNNFLSWIASLLFIPPPVFEKCDKLKLNLFMNIKNIYFEILWNIYDKLKYYIIPKNKIFFLNH